MYDNYLKEQKAYIKSKVKPDSWVFHPITCFALLLVTLFIDFVAVNTFFHDIRNENSMAPTLGVLFVIDVMPMFLLPSYKYRYTKVEKSPTWMLFLSAAILVLKMSMLVWTKIALMEILNASNSIPITIPQIILEALIPLGTSIVNGLSAWHSFHPLKNRIVRAETRRAVLEFELMCIRSSKAKYDACTDDYMSALERQVKRKFVAHVGTVNAYVADLKIYFRNCLAERLANPQSVTQLSAVFENLELPQQTLDAFIAPVVSDSSILSDFSDYNDFSDINDFSDSLTELDINPNQSGPTKLHLEEDNNEKSA